MYNSVDSEGESYALGGVVTFVSEADRYNKEWGRKGNRGDMRCIGSFDIKGWADSGFLYMLGDFDKAYYAHIPLKDNEMLFRYESYATKVASIMPIVKINIEKGLIYFIKDLYADDDKNLVFETVGVKARYMSLHVSVYVALAKQSNYVMKDNFDAGGGIEPIGSVYHGGRLTPSMINNSFEQNLDVLTIGCFIKARNTGRMLMVKRAGSDYAGSWGLVSGFVKPDEIPQDAAKREIQEELNLDINSDNLRLLDTTKMPSATHFFYEIYVNDEFAPELNSENSEFMWVNMNDLPVSIHPLLMKYMKSKIFVC